MAIVLYLHNCECLLIRVDILERRPESLSSTRITKANWPVFVFESNTMLLNIFSEILIPAAEAEKNTEIDILNRFKSTILSKALEVAFYGKDRQRWWHK